MGRWIDVKESDWYYAEIEEASRIVLEDGQPFIIGIPYNAFEPGAPYFYEEHTAIKGQVVFTLSKKITPSNDSPLFVYVDGVQTLYKSVKDNSSGTSDVELYSAPREGAIVSFAMYGKPVVDKFGKPRVDKAYEYPKYKLAHGDSYVYVKFGRSFNEYVYAFGRALKRAPVEDEEWQTSNWEDVAKKYIGYQTDVYCVAPGGIVYMPYNLNNVTCTISYLYVENGNYKIANEKFKPTASEVLYVNRFFPKAYITRGEAYALIDRLRRHFYSRFTDTEAPSNKMDETYIAYEAQQVFRLNGRYPVGTGLLQVKVDGVLKKVNIDYTEFDDHTVLFKYPLKKGSVVNFSFVKDKSTRFEDVGYDKSMKVVGTGEIIHLNGSKAWWKDVVLAMEDEKLNDGTYLIQGYENVKYDVDGTILVDDMYNPLYDSSQKNRVFLANSLLTRAEAVVFLNRFRKWCIERFKI